jgi:outer membrane protein
MRLSARRCLQAAVILLSLMCLTDLCLAQESAVYSLPSIIDYALKNNPRIRIFQKEIETEAIGIDAAKAERMPRIDFGTGATKYRYPMPLTPIVISSTYGIEIPDFEKTIYDAGLVFRLPLFKGGRLMRGVRAAEMKQAMARENYALSKQDLIYNLTSVYYKIAQLKRLHDANVASVKQLESHRRDVEHFLQAGTVPKLDLLKVNVELSHARERRLVVANNAESVHELLKTLMGIEDTGKQIGVEPGEDPGDKEDIVPSLEEALSAALSRRPDYRAILKKKELFEERVKIARGRRLPDVFLAGNYSGNAGNNFAFKENWSLGVRLVVPVLDGGLIKAEIDRERMELEKVKEEERLVRLSINREVKDALLGMANAKERIAVTEAAIESARESLRVELVKYTTGSGTSTDVVDAQTVLLRTQTDYYQALYDRQISLASLRKAAGEDGCGNGTNDKMLRSNAERGGAQ